MDVMMKEDLLIALRNGAAANMRLAQRAMNEYYEQQGDGASTRRMYAAQEVATNAQRAAMTLETAHELEMWWERTYGLQAELHKNCLE